MIKAISKYCIISCLIFTSVIITGCNSVSNIELTNVKLVNKQVQVGVPNSWTKLQEKIGSTHKIIYKIENTAAADTNDFGTAVIKFQKCDTQLKSQMYKEYVLRNNSFEPDSGNTIIYDKQKDGNWYCLKWQGTDKDKTFIIWDFIGVDNDIAGHIRATCPMTNSTKQLISKMDKDIQTLADSIVITASLTESQPAEDKEE